MSSSPNIELPGLTSAAGTKPQKLTLLPTQNQPQISGPHITELTSNQLLPQYGTRAVFFLVEIVGNNLEEKQRLSEPQKGPTTSGPAAPHTAHLPEGSVSGGERMSGGELCELHSSPPDIRSSPDTEPSQQLSSQHEILKSTIVPIHHPRWLIRRGKEQSRHRTLTRC